MPWLTAIPPVKLAVSGSNSSSCPGPLLTKPSLPLIVEFNSKAPPFTAKLALLASVIGVLIDCVPLVTVTLAVPLPPLSVRLPLLSV